MEKPRMDRRFSLFRSRLLICCLFYPVLTVQAQTDAGTVNVEVQIDSEFSVPWILTFLVDHPFPQEVAIRYPPFPPTLTLERVHTGARVIESKRWSAIELWFIPQEPEAVTLQPFEITTPNKRALTPVIVLGAVREYFSWRNPPDSLKIGEAGDLSLYLSNWDPRKPLPNQELLRKKVPEQAILEELPLSESDRRLGLLLHLRIIPLGGQEFSLEPVRIRHEGLTLEVPGVKIPLIPKEQEDRRKPVPPPPPETPPAEVSFPEIQVPVFPLFRSDYEKTLQGVRGLWEQGHIPEALAELRRNEREHLAGPYFASLRQEAERRLGFEFAQDELWRPRKLFILSFLGSIGVLIPLVIRLIRNHFIRVPPPREKTVTSPVSWGFVIILAALALLSVGLYRPQSRKTGLAILRAAGAYRVPDADGGISAYFNEGQPVIIRSISDSWVYVESFDGKIGWVLRDKVIVY